LKAVGIFDQLPALRPGGPRGRRNGTPVARPRAAAIDSTGEDEAWEFRDGDPLPYKSTADVLRGLKEASVPRFATGIPTLDRKTRGGIPRGRLAVIVGRPGGGKTGIALSVAGHLAGRADILVVTYLADAGLEAGVVRLAQRFGADRDRLEAGDADEVARAIAAAPPATNVIYLDPDDPRTSLDLLFATIDKLAEGRTIFLVVDSAQVVRPGRATKPGDIRLTVKDVADRLKVELRRRHAIGFLVSQQARAGYRSKKADERADPLASAAESSALEYMADVLLVVDPTDDDGAKVFIAKSRIGGRGATFHLALDRDRCVYREVDAAALQDEESSRQEEEQRRRVTADAGKLADVLQKNAEGLSVTAIRGALRWNHARTNAALSELERQDRVFGEASERRGGGWRWRLVVTRREGENADAG